MHGLFGQVRYAPGSLGEYPVFMESRTLEFFILLIALGALWVLFNVPILYYAVGLNGLFFLIMGNVFVGALQIVLAVAAHFWQERDRTPPATMDE